MMYVECDVWAGREGRGVNGGMKKSVMRWPKREEHLRNSYKDIG